MWLAHVAQHVAYQDEQVEEKQRRKMEELEKRKDERWLKAHKRQQNAERVRSIFFCALFWPPSSCSCKVRKEKAFKQLQSLQRMEAHTKRMEYLEVSLSGTVFCA